MQLLVGKLFVPLDLNAFRYAIRYTVPTDIPLVGIIDMEVIAMKSFSYPSLCGNIKQSVDCKTAACHKAAGRIPRFISFEVAPFVSFGQQRFIWRNMPALDILKMKDNEGLKELSRDISLIFAASGDCRNAIKSVVGLPKGYKGRCTVVLNDRDFAVVARNVIILLSALQLDPGVNVPIMIHLWYSALIPAIMLETLQKEVLPYIKDVCAKIKDKLATSLQEKTFKLSNGSLHLLLKKEQWFQLASFFKVPKGLTS